MKKVIILIFFIIQIACSGEKKFNAKEYHKNVNLAELAICETDFYRAVDLYKNAFKNIQKPFGNDVYNAALSSHFAKRDIERDEFLQILINNSNDYDMIKESFINIYVPDTTWTRLFNQKKVDYNEELRNEFEEILERDQLFRPMYESHGDTIEANRLINLHRILELTDYSGFPSQNELGYREYLRGQDHDIVLHHTAQRRSTDKSVLDLESLLREAVNEGRFDPEQAILYLHMQNDDDKKDFFEYSTWQYRHSQLPDSLNNKVWVRKFDEKELQSANKTRTHWYADQIEDINTKASFLSKHKLPFLFTSVRNNIGNISEDFDYEKALEQYNSFITYKNLMEVKNDVD